MALTSSAGQYTIGSVAGAAFNNKNGSLIFPLDLVKQPFWMSFSFYEYKMPSPLMNQQNEYYIDKGTIRLPLPNSMVDDQHVQFSPDSVVPSVALGGMATAAGKAVGALTGTAMNPMLTVMFKQPTFKQHSLEWKLTPSNQNESQTLNSIVNSFKYNMLPDSAGAGVLLSYPNIVQIRVSAADPDFFTYVFKPAVIESFSVNYTPSGTPSFFGTTKAPTEVQIRLGLMEIEYWLASHYGSPRDSVLDSTKNAATAILNGVKGYFGLGG
jgi:hypothetical protein